MTTEIFETNQTPSHDTWENSSGERRRSWFRLVLSNLKPMWFELGYPMSHLSQSIGIQCSCWGTHCIHYTWSYNQWLLTWSKFWAFWAYPIWTPQRNQWKQSRSGPKADCKVFQGSFGFSKLPKPWKITLFNRYQIKSIEIISKRTIFHTNYKRLLAIHA